MKRIALLLTVLCLILPAGAHYKAKYHVIVDTDGGIDDFRTICMLLASPEIEVIAITAVDGMLSPEETAKKVTALLRSFGHEGIPVGVGKTTGRKIRVPGTLRDAAGSLRWGEDLSEGLPVLPGAADLIRLSIELEEMPVDILALGPMTNLAEAFGDLPASNYPIRRIYWFTGEGDKKAFNYAADPDAAGYMQQYAFPMDRISSGEMKTMDSGVFLSGLDTVRSVYAVAVREAYREHPVLSRQNKGTETGSDLVPLYLTHPSLFRAEEVSPAPQPRIVTVVKPDSLAFAIPLILDGNREDKTIIFNRFPVDPDLFEEDVAVLTDELIRRHGLKEWKLVVITNEFHEHLGIYSIIGAKMGLRAREYFNLGIDELTIKALAGSQPPVSCMIDGLQASTGATLGHGTISVAEEGPAEPAALFSFKNTTIRIGLRDELREKIRNEVKAGVRAHGLNTEAYWVFIREKALQYWLEFDRRDIFEITVLER